MAQEEDSLKNIAVLINSAETDSIRIAACRLLRSGLENMFTNPIAYDYPYDSLRLRTVSILAPPDKKFRLFTFNLVLKNGNFKNYGYLLYYIKKELQVVTLEDTAKKWNKENLDLELEANEWIGALYYKIVPFKKGKQNMYLLFGYDGSTIHSNKKILDVLTIKKGEVRFGAPVFKNSDQDPSAEYRVVFEFHNQSGMVMQYEETKKIIVVDKLAPSYPEAINNFYLYIPTGDYDYFGQDKYGNWVKHDFKEFNVGIETENPEREPTKPRKHRKL